MSDHARTRSYKLITAYDTNGPKWRIADKGVVWIMNRFAAAREDLFTKPPRERSGATGGAVISPTLLRKVLGEARLPLANSLHSELWSDEEVLLSSGSLMVSHNREAWLAWSEIATGFLCVGDRRASIAWRQRRRGRSVLVGMTLPKIGLSHREDWRRTP